MHEPLKITKETARRLAVLKQGLSGQHSKPTPKGLLDVARKIRCIQVDPTSAVARTEQIVLFSRLGPRFNPQQLADATYKRKELFHYWAHAASLVLTEDYPIHYQLMRTWPRHDSLSGMRANKFMKDNVSTQRHILRRLRNEGPLRARDFEVTMGDPWRSSGWTGGQNLGRILDFLWVKGKIMIVGRKGPDRVWGLADEYFPDWTPRDRLTEREVVTRSVRASVAALGVATPKQISQHFVRERYPNLPQVIDQLVKSDEVIPVEVIGADGPLSGEWLALACDVPVIERLSKRDGFDGRTTLLSPFDNLICDRARTEQLFDFNYRIEIYVPAAKRRYGYYVLPILNGDTLIGRIDSRFDRKTGVYAVDNVYAEAGAPRDRQTGRAVRDAIDSIAEWLGAESIRFGRAEAWSSALR